jgi:hypothetical protein
MRHGVTSSLYLVILPDGNAIKNDYNKSIEKLCGLWNNADAAEMVVFEKWGAIRMATR